MGLPTVTSVSPLPPLLPPAHALAATNATTPTTAVMLSWEMLRISLVLWIEFMCRLSRRDEARLHRPVVVALCSDPGVALGAARAFSVMGSLLPGKTEDSGRSTAPPRRRRGAEPV